MSHLIHVLKVKEQLVDAGVLCPEEQSHMLNEGYIRAGLSYVYKDGGCITDDVKNRLWGMLEKWNSVSPINANFIYQSIVVRLKEIIDCMIKNGSLPCPLKFTLRSDEEAGNVNIADMAEFPTLVQYLIKELENCHE